MTCWKETSAFPSYSTFLFYERAYQKSKIIEEIERQRGGTRRSNQPDKSHRRLFPPLRWLQVAARLTSITQEPGQKATSEKELRPQRERVCTYVRMYVYCTEPHGNAGHAERETTRQLYKPRNVRRENCGGSSVKNASQSTLWAASCFADCNIWEFRPSRPWSHPTPSRRWEFPRCSF